MPSNRAESIAEERIGGIPSYLDVPHTLDEALTDSTSIVSVFFKCKDDLPSYVCDFSSVQPLENDFNFPVHPNQDASEVDKNMPSLI